LFNWKTLGFRLGLGRSTQKAFGNVSH